MKKIPGKIKPKILIPERFGLPFQLRSVRRRVRTRRAKGKGRSSKLTWTLVALRAATEPAKEEAMQAIVLEVFGVCVEFGLCAEE